MPDRAETIRSAHDTIRYDAHDTIRSAIHLPFLLGKQRLVISACDQKHCTPPTTTACAVMMHSGYNNGGLLGVFRCSVFVMNSPILLEYIDCFLWYLVFVSNFGICYICTVSCRIVLRAYSDTYRSLCIGDIPVCWCIVSALMPEKLHCSIWLDHLTYWGRVTHICIANLTIIGSDNGLLLGRSQSIIWSKAGILLNRPLGTNISEILTEIPIFSFKKMRLKVSSAKWRPFCFGLNVFTNWGLVMPHGDRDLCQHWLG